MLKASQIDQIEEKVIELLERVGIAVESDEVTRLCVARGCTTAEGHRVRIPRRVVADMAASQRRTEREFESHHELVPLCGPDWAHHLEWTRGQDAFRELYKTRFLTQAFDCGPITYYDYPAGRSRPVDTGIFDAMMRFAEATPEIGYTSMWYRQDVPPEIERLASLRRAMNLTTKFAGIEAIYPEVVKYLKEVSEILTDNPASSAYLAGSECMTPPLALEKRSADDILERKKYGVNRYHVACMPTLGVSTPATLAGAVVMSAAELLGGMALCWCVDPEGDLSGRMITLVGDMRNGNSTTLGPFYTQLNMAVRQLFVERWGGHCMVEVFLGPTAQRAGLQAVFENWYVAQCRQTWENRCGIPYPGMGSLMYGALGSPTQLMLDIDIRKAQWLAARDIDVNEETLDFDEVLRVAETKGNFLLSEHTLRHCRELWSSPYFRSDAPTAGKWDGSEKAILDKCDDAWRANLAKWQPPVWPAEKIRAIDAVIARAAKEFQIDAEAARA